MICTEKANRKCSYSFGCDIGCQVADESECADFIVAVEKESWKEDGHDESTC